MASLADVRDALAAGPLSVRSHQILELARPSLRLATSSVALEDLALGASRIGGVPDLPAGRSWPRWKGEPQSFLAQIDLSSLRGFPAASALPPSGWLCFFYSARQDTWGFDPNDRESWLVVHTPADTPVVRTSAPDDMPDEGLFQPCRATPEEGVTLPPWDSGHVERLRLNEVEEEQYFELLDSLTHGDSHRLLGHPDQIQGDMTVACQLASNGLNTGDSGGWSDPRVEELKKGWSDWQLLMQVASDDAARMMWGDLGCLYFWIREADLRAGELDQVWMILQCS